MLIPVLIILFFFLIKLTIKKAQQKVNVNRHVGIRLGVLVIFIALAFLISYLIEGRRGILGAFYINAYFVGAWLFYLIVEAISLFVVKQPVLARSNLLILTIIISILTIVAIKFA